MTVDELIVWVGDGRWQLVDGEPRHGAGQRNAWHHPGERRLHPDPSFARCRQPMPSRDGPRHRTPRSRPQQHARARCGGHLFANRDAGQLVLPDPLLVVEVLSPTNEQETWENVWTYVSIPSVQEILVLRSASIAADVLRRRTDGTWPEEPIQIGRDETLRLECIGLTCPLAEFYIGTYLVRSW
jgi:hypothetical protein